MRAHDAGERIAIGDAEAGKAERDRLSDQFLRMRGAAQEGEIGGDGEFRIGGHAFLTLARYANRPCTYQRGCAVSAP